MRRTLILTGEVARKAACREILAAPEGFAVTIGERQKKRSIPQNAISHAWYQQLAAELREDDALGWKCYCKLHHGIPILRAEDAEFKYFYDKSIKGMTYEQKLMAMKYLPVTSLMNKDQLSAYLESVQKDFADKGVRLEFPLESAA